MVLHDRLPSPVIMGEVLFDRFPDGRDVLGGAPFNVAWHLEGFGFQPRLVTRVGDDLLGVRVREAMAEWGMSARWVQTDRTRGTGRVDVRFEDEEPTFTIPPGQAFDRIAKPGADIVAGPGRTILYHGTLAFREAPLKVLHDLRELCGKVFLDVNLRPPWWERARTAELMDGADWVKMNIGELAVIAPDGDAPGLCERHGLEGLIVTAGEDVVRWVTAEGDVASVRPPLVTDIVDSVGAGDAFSSVCIVGLIEGWTPDTILEYGVAFAADVCRRRGAVAADPDLYDRNWILRPAPVEEDQ
jgi:fructokinase